MMAWVWADQFWVSFLGDDWQGLPLVIYQAIAICALVNFVTNFAANLLPDCLCCSKGSPLKGVTEFVIELPSVNRGLCL